MINFDRLLIGYVRKQTIRVRRAVMALRQRDAEIRLGRTIPVDGSLANGSGRQVEAAVLFLDICGFSGRHADTIDQQRDILAAFTLLFPEVIAIVEDCGGTVEKNTGDGLMAYFVQRGGVNYVQRAVACAMSVFYATDRMIDPALRERGVTPFQFRISIDAGPITIARVGRKSGFGGFVAIGSAANRASKMLAHAGAMEIILGRNAFANLPQGWAAYATLKTPTTWDWYRADGTPYHLWEFSGRWPDPTTPPGGRTWL